MKSDYVYSVCILLHHAALEHSSVTLFIDSAPEMMMN